jgi:predicted metal-dependent hydrolase
MSQLVVRRLLIDLAEPFARDWNGGDAFRTAFFNALSMSFPVGEQFFIDSVRQGVKALPAEAQQRFAGEVQGFVGQEATHRRVHGLFNGQLALQGHVNAWETRIRQRLKRLDGADARHTVAVTAATEHLTAILSKHLLNHPEALDGAEPRLRTMWLWHAAEESEHRSTAFDVYLALGGNEAWRRRWFRIVTAFFVMDVMRQTLRNLRHDGQLGRWATWRSAARYLFGPHGLVRETVGPWRAYLRAGFHPAQQDAALSRQWLEDNRAQYRVVGEAPTG